MWRSLHAIGILALLVPAVRAQTQISLPGCSLKGANFTISGNCALYPLGTGSVTLVSKPVGTTGTLDFKATFSFTGGGFSAVDQGEAYTAMGDARAAQGTATISGGTGAFAGVSGSLTYSFMGTGSLDNQTATLSGSGSISLQTVNTTLPDGMTGVPYSNYIGQGLSQIPAGAQFRLSDGSSLPPGLTLASSGLLSGTPTAAGDYNFGISYHAMSQSATLQASLKVAANPGPAVSVSPGSLSFSLTQGATSAATQSIVIVNSGDVAQKFTISPAAGGGGNWLSASQSAGTLAPFGSTSVSVNVTAGKLNTGTYLGKVTVKLSPAGQEFDISVIAAVSGGQSQLRLSQSGFRFQTVDEGGAPRSQPLLVLSSGSGTLKFSVAVSTTSGGQWLSAASSTDSVTPTSPASVTLSVDSSRLEFGNYYGQVQISADGAANSPQAASVVLNVAPEGTRLDSVIYPYGLIFVGPERGANPAAKTISITNPSPSSLHFTAGTSFGQPTPWFNVQPIQGSVSGASPATLTVQPSLSGLSAGLYIGDIELNFAENGSTRHVAVLLIVTPAPQPDGEGHIQAHATAPTCKPSKLLPLFTQLGSNFTTVAAWPTPVEVVVVDDCGSPMTSGDVTASFSDGDPSLALTSLNDGRWSATWQPRAAGAQVVITVDAAQLIPSIRGTQSIGGSLATNPTTPSINAGGVVTAAKSAPNQPLAPGAFTSIFGAHLSAGQNPALSLPLAGQLGSTQVVLGGRPLPLQFAGDGQVNAVIPYDMPANTTQQLLVTNGPALSVPEPVVIAPAQPAVFALADGSGVVFDVKPGSSDQVLVDASHPISAGDAIVIYCAGLGPVDPPVMAGSAAPSSPPATTTNAVTVKIGGKTASVFFGGLVGGFAGLYQVNAHVPAGIAPGDAVPLVVTVAGFDSAPVTVAVK